MTVPERGGEKKNWKYSEKTSIIVGVLHAVMGHEAENEFVWSA